MSIDPDHLRECVIEPVLKYLDLYSPVAVQLLLGTAAQESHLGSYLKQLGNGPARSIYQIERATWKDLHHNFLNRPRFAELNRRTSTLLIRQGFGDGFDELPGNLYYATAIARLIYFRVPEPLPTEGNISGLAAYWKRNFNTPLGKGTMSEFVLNYKRLVLGEKL